MHHLRPTCCRVSALLAHAHDYIAEVLQLGTATALWCFIDAEPRLAVCENDALYDDVVDVDTACFEYHIAHFTELAEPIEPGGSPPLHALPVELMHRLLMSGLLSVPTAQLKAMVAQYALARHQQHGELLSEADICAKLFPPATMFNRQIRDTITGSRGLRLGARSLF